MDLSSEIYHALLPAFITIVLGLPVTALGAIDGIAEATANFAKLASGRLSDRSLQAQAVGDRGLWPRGAVQAVVPARGERGDGDGRALRRPHRQGHPRLPARRDDRRRDAARNPRPRVRAEAGARHRRRAARAARRDRADGAGSRATSARSIWVAIIPAACSFLLAWLALREPEQQRAPLKRSPFFAGFRQLDRETKRLLAVGFLFGLARFSEGFLILKGIEVGPVAKRCRR